MKENEPVLEATSAILLAAGLSTRMGGTDPTAPRKPFIVLEGLTVVEHACAAFDRSKAVREIVLVGHEDDVARLQSMSLSCSSMRKVRAVVVGGELRTDSVRAGLARVDPQCTIIAIHDVARPLIETSMIDLAIARASERGAALVAIPVTDTIKTSSDGQHAESTLDRGVLWSAQTPQVFRIELFRRLLGEAQRESFRPTDDSALHERYAGPIALVRGSLHNLKLTTPEDLLLASSILRARDGARRS